MLNSIKITLCGVSNPALHEMSGVAVAKLTSFDEIHSSPLHQWSSDEKSRVATAQETSRASITSAQSPRAESEDEPEKFNSPK